MHRRKKALEPILCRRVRWLEQRFFFSCSISFFESAFFAPCDLSGSRIWVHLAGRVGSPSICPGSRTISDYRLCERSARPVPNGADLDCATRVTQCADNKMQYCFMIVHMIDYQNGLFIFYWWGNRFYIILWKIAGWLLQNSIFDIHIGMGTMGTEWLGRKTFCRCCIVGIVRGENWKGPHVMAKS